MKEEKIQWDRNDAEKKVDIPVEQECSFFGSTPAQSTNQSFVPWQPQN